jgi:sugar lactone lactonase YvrE
MVGVFIACVGTLLIGCNSRASKDNPVARESRSVRPEVAGALQPPAEPAGVPPSQLPQVWNANDRPIDTKMEVLAEFFGPMPTGVTVSRNGRVFVCFPKWDDPVAFTVAEMRGGRAEPFPNANINRDDPAHPDQVLVSVQSVVVDPLDRLWVLDTGSTHFGPTVEGGPKLVAVDLATDQVVKTISFPPTVALRQSYLNDVRFDLRRGKGGFAFITDSSTDGSNGIIVVDLDSGKSWRKLNDHPSTKAEPNFTPIVEGQPLMVRTPGSPPKPLSFGSDGIAISADGSRLYYCPLASRKLYSASTDALADPDLSDAEVARTVRDHGEKGASDGLESDSLNRVYVTDYENNAILRRLPDGQMRLLIVDPRIIWPDTLSVATNGYLYFTINQVDRMARFHEGKDLREKPYVLARIKVDAEPVRLMK